tara:strand:- start:107 stop:829 length:723 start_codon:yes stop_codon:yes gene_type:complete
MKKTLLIALTSFPLLGGETILNCKYTDSHRNYPAPKPYVINERGTKFTFEDRCDQINYYNGLKNRRENGRFFFDEGICDIPKETSIYFNEEEQYVGVIPSYGGGMQNDYSEECFTKDNKNYCKIRKITGTITKNNIYYRNFVDLEYKECFDYLQSEEFEKLSETDKKNFKKNSCLSEYGNGYKFRYWHLIIDRNYGSVESRNRVNTIDINGKNISVKYKEGYGPIGSEAEGSCSVIKKKF